MLHSTQLIIWNRSFTKPIEFAAIHTITQVRLTHLFEGVVLRAFEMHGILTRTASPHNTLPYSQILQSNRTDRIGHLIQKLSMNKSGFEWIGIDLNDYLKVMPTKGNELQ